QDVSTQQDSVQQFRRYRELLARAYDDFVRSTPAKEKVFQVLQQVEGQRVSLDALRANLHRDARAKESPVTHPEAA
ncbi:MAG TPA: nitrogenase-stabilizing/protective protein NifW, partial [Burkholderiaceae bacterium]|nr:nitrogenase-stabilizing/protective protein NifW [Burkholderiaceae bacterium]